jgi:predicted 2-oxoglutarate/Fe(II)-dependent dioxygenase YbiX
MQPHWAITFRADVSNILLLSEEHDYDEGELGIQDMHSARRIKLTAGTPCFAGQEACRSAYAAAVRCLHTGLGRPCICMP